jgi:hypothetical protein
MVENTKGNGKETGSRSTILNDFEVDIRRRRNDKRHKRKRDEIQRQYKEQRVG